MADNSSIPHPALATDSTSKARVLLAAGGGLGELYPILAAARALDAEGHSVKVMANPHFASLVSDAGLNFVPYGTQQEYKDYLQDPRCGIRERSGNADEQVAQELVRRSLYQIRDVMTPMRSGDNDPGYDLVIHSSSAIGAGLMAQAAEKPSLHLMTSPYNLWFDAKHLPIVDQMTATIARLPQFAQRALRFVDDHLLHNLREHRNRMNGIDRKGEPTVPNGGHLGIINQFLGTIGASPAKDFYGDIWKGNRKALSSIAVATTQGFADLHPLAEGSVRYLGAVPAIPSSRPLPDAFIKTLGGRTKPIIMRFGGNSIADETSILEAAKVAREDGGQLVVVGETIPESVKREPNVVVLSRLNLVEAAPFARCVIATGGPGECLTAMRAGAPLVIIPGAAEGQDTAQRLEGYAAIHRRGTMRDSIQQAEAKVRTPQAQDLCKKVGLDKPNGFATMLRISVDGLLKAGRYARPMTAEVH
jgi:UDP:flavonoid glycosyltransferase YjiC (YdhE family)